MHGVHLVGPVVIRDTLMLFIECVGLGGFRLHIPILHEQGVRVVDCGALAPADGIALCDEVIDETLV